MSVKSRLTILASVALLSTLVLTAATQTANPVSVSAEVRDGNDRVVVGLTKGNFEVLEDRVEQTITVFRERGNQDEITYSSTNAAKDGRWRAIRVNVVGLPPSAGAVEVRAKQGYAEKSQ